jgi:hypothetical protein
MTSDLALLELSLASARGAESLLIAAKDLLLDAESEAKDGQLTSIAQWIRARIDSLDDELLPEVRATVKMLEKRQAEARHHERCA